MIEVTLNGNPLRIGNGRIHDDLNGWGDALTMMLDLRRRERMIPHALGDVEACEMLGEMGELIVTSETRPGLINDVEFDAAMNPSDLLSAMIGGQAIKGGPGSGYHSEPGDPHRGRPGQRGGSLPDDEGGGEDSPDISAEKLAALRRRMAELMEESKRVFAEGKRLNSNEPLLNSLSRPKIAASVGVTTEVVAKMQRFWIGKSARNLVFQKAVADEFGTSLSEWQQKNGTHEYAQWTGDPIDPSLPWREFARALHADTQEFLSSLGLKSVTLYRGVVIPKDSTIVVGGVVTADDNAASSWTLDPAMAEEYASGEGGTTSIGSNTTSVVLSHTFPIERVLGIGGYNLGNARAQEYIVIGQNEPLRSDVVNVYQPDKPYP